MSSRSGARIQLGAGVAGALSGAWRDAPPPWDVDESSLSSIAAPLLQSGAAGLAWRRLRSSTLVGSPVAAEFHQAYRLQVLHATLHEEDLVRAFKRSRRRGIEPVLGKGWAAAQLYSDPCVRPYGDIDLYVSTQTHSLARAAIFDPEGPSCAVDLHVGFAELDDRTPDEIAARSVNVTLNDEAIRTFGPEDHLRLLCLHALRHGLLRPMWLCDVAAALESAPPSFDWDRFRSGDQRRTRWAITALVLARTVLGASLDALPATVQLPSLPHWLVPAVLREWGSPRIPQGARDPMRHALRRPAMLLRALRVRWPNAIEATVGVGGTFSAWPRLPYQFAESVRRSALFARALVHS